MNSRYGPVVAAAVVDAVVDHPDDQRLGVAAGVAAMGASSASHDPSASVSIVAGFHVRAWLATTDPRRSPRPAATTGTRRTRDRRAPTCPARAGRPASRPACSPPSCRRRPRRRRWRGSRTRRAPTTRACGNAARSPLFTPGRPNHSAFTTLSATSRHVPSIATSRRPASHAPGVSTVANGARDPVEQRLHRLGPQPFRAWKIADFDGNFTGSAIAARPRQPVGQQAHHVLIRALRVQRHPHREVRHHPRRQRPMPLLGPPRPGDHLIHHLRREHPRQQPHRHQIRQPTIRLRLHPTSTRHPPKLHRCNPN